MARHTKLFNALTAFYFESIDSLVSELDMAFVKRFFDSEEFEIAKSSFNENALAVVDLAKDQSIHFCKRSKLVPEWEMELIVEEVCEHIEKKMREMKRKGVFGQTHKIKFDGAGSRWEQIVDGASDA